MMITLLVTGGLVTKRKKVMFEDKQIWNKINFTKYVNKRYGEDELEISVNEWGDGPIILEMSGESVDTISRCRWMKPDEARDLARRLIQAADATDLAGRIKKDAA